MNLVDRLSKLYTGAVYDVLRARGRPDQVLPSSLVPLDPGQPLAGVVFTMAGELDENIGDHESLLLWTGFLSSAPADSVVVCQPHDDTLSHIGELSAETLAFRGVRGYVVDGGARDVSFLINQAFPVWCRYTTPRDVVGRWAVRQTGQPIEIGGVQISTGDYLLADRDGVVVIPAEVAAEVISDAEQVLQTENKVRSAILTGVDPQEAYLQYGKF